MKTPTLHARRVHKLSGVSPSPPSEGGEGRGEGEAASCLTRVVTGLLVSDRVALSVCI